MYINWARRRATWPTEIPYLRLRYSAMWRRVVWWKRTTVCQERTVCINRVAVSLLSTYQSARRHVAEHLSNVSFKWTGRSNSCRQVSRQTVEGILSSRKEVTLLSTLCACVRACVYLSAPLGVTVCGLTMHRSASSVVIWRRSNRRHGEPRIWNGSQRTRSVTYCIRICAKKTTVNVKVHNGKVRQTNVLLKDLTDTTISVQCAPGDWTSHKQLSAKLPASPDRLTCANPTAKVFFRQSSCLWLSAAFVTSWVNRLRDTVTPYHWVRRLLVLTSRCQHQSSSSAPAGRLTGTERSQLHDWWSSLQHLTVLSSDWSRSSPQPPAIGPSLLSPTAFRNTERDFLTLHCGVNLSAQVVSTVLLSPPLEGSQTVMWAQQRTSVAVPQERLLSGRYRRIAVCAMAQPFSCG